jgi:hypothetical protein
MPKCDNDSRIARARMRPVAVGSGGCTRPAAIALGVVLGFALAGCASSVGNTPTFLADPGTYEFFSCEQLATHRTAQEKRRADLRELIDKAERSPAGVLMGVMSYRIDHASATEEIKVIDATARAKNCAPPPTWRSTTAIR